MIILAVVLLVLVVVLAVLVMLDGGQRISLDLIFGAQLDTTVTVVFVTGIVLGAIALGAVALLRVGLRRDRRHRREVKDLKRRAGEGERTHDTAAPAPADHPHGPVRDRHGDETTASPTPPEPIRPDTGFSAPDTHRSDPTR